MAVVVHAARAFFGVRGEGVEDTPGSVDIRKGSINVKNIIGRKVGMTSVFTEDGRSVPVTVIQAGPCTVVQKKTKETDGYEAVALPYGDPTPARPCEAIQGHYKKAGLAPKRDIREFRVGIDGVELGATITVDGFAQGDRGHVQGFSKGHRFAGGLK